MAEGKQELQLDLSGVLDEANGETVLQFYGKSHADDPWLPLDRNDDVSLGISVSLVCLKQRPVQG